MTLRSLAGQTVDVVKVAVRLVGMLGLELVMIELFVVEARPIVSFGLGVNAETRTGSADLLVLDALPSLVLGERIGSGGSGSHLGELTCVRTLVDISLIGEADALFGMKTLNFVGLGHRSASSLGARDVRSDLLRSSSAHVVGKGTARSSSGYSSKGGASRVGEEGAARSAEGGCRSVSSGTAGLFSLNSEALAHNGALLSLRDESGWTPGVQDSGRHLSKLRH